ncbi:Stk1 family PASTA domain-containing Ser/Thr kinase [Tissierella creatinini]|nr:Stk1 family PASTA domain-containing Ser/Thr kinase [Tissierella creatinini]TJX69198.1 Stk1 family PASTA domain-containing Ser/Thr kinase [Soehngenia saccharolytica]
MIGFMLGNRYEIIEKVGEGGMAIVYKAKCHLLNRFVAIKVLRDEFTEDEDFIRKFRRESQAAASLSHPNILNIYDVGVEELEGKKIYYIVMEFINGKTLKELIKVKGKLSPEETIEYSIQIGEALKHAHRNHIVHRDIKPHNMMITEDNRIKVTDFGIARAVTSSTVTTTSNVLGSVHYFSPEQARGGYTDEKSDIYSLGIVMYEMITGKVPYDGDSPISVALKHIQSEVVAPSDLDATIPTNLESIILKCIQKRQSDRYANVTDLLQDLRALKGSGLIPINDSEVDSATRIIPVLDIKEDEEVKEAVKKKKNSINKKKSKNKKEGGGFVVFLGILLAFLLVTSIFYGYAKLKDILIVDEVTMIDILGMQEEVADKELKKLGLVLNVTDRVKSSEYDSGEVMYQSVDPDTKIKSGFTVDVTISTGVELTSVPLLINKPLEEAEAMIEAAGLKIGQIDPGFSDVIPKGSVIEQDPEALDKKAPGTRINLIVSEGPEVKTVIMPNLVNSTITEARNTLKGSGLVVGEVTPQPSDSVDKDRVIWQSYEQRTELETGTSVDLYISSGPEKEPDPDPDEEEPTEKMVTTTITLSPLMEKEETEFKIMRNQDGETIVVYNKMHKAADGDFVLTFKSKPGATFDILRDGVYQGTTSPAQ